MYDIVNNAAAGRDTSSTDVYMPNVSLIKDVKFGAKNVNLNVVILFLGKPVITKSGQTVCTCRIADSSGSVDLSLWDELSKLLRSGDIISIHNGYASGFKGRLSLNVGRGGYIEKIEEFCFSFEELPNFSETPLDSSSSSSGLKSTNGISNSLSTTNTNTTVTTSGSIGNNKHPMGGGGGGLTLMNPTSQLNKLNKFNEVSVDPRKANSSYGAASLTTTSNYKSSTTSNNITKPRNNNNFSTPSNIDVNARSTSSKFFSSQIHI